VLAGGAATVGLVQCAGVASARARGARVARRVRAGIAGAVALIQGAGVGIGGAGRPERLLDVGGAGGARASAVVGKITLPGGRAADRARVACRVLAGGAGTIAHVPRAGGGIA